ncbi:MAG TPA: PQQ-dependent sugar dehydrogenase, partial [Sphingobacteriaceae bacterium]
MLKHLFTIVGWIILLLGCSKNNSSTSEGPLADAELEVRVLASDLFHPWELVWGPDNRIWMTERNGQISRVDPESGQVSNLITISDVSDVGEGGLLGMALHPNFTSTPQVFVVYNYDKNGIYTEKVVRYDYTGSTLVNPITILDDIAAANFHDGSRLLFGPDQKLYITTGDAGNTASSQNPLSLNGKVLRLNPDGSVPADNPDPASPVWSMGHRNAQGLVFGKGKLYSSEHGPNTDDEINIIGKSQNFGWPIVHGLCNEPAEQAFCNEMNVVQPVYSWT